MSIKSDKWIRRMAEQHGMIEPFEPGQIRHAANGQRIVSYGTSSYGYDIRCAPEFKVFTNVHSTVVDPKVMLGELDMLAENGIAVLERQSPEHTYVIGEDAAGGVFVSENFYYDSEIHNTKIYAVTDRPLYRPGDEVFVKFLGRELRSARETRAAAPATSSRAAAMV